MAKLTDEELERLLRETFADKEELLDSLPQATKRWRPVAPLLLAAAAVLVVLGSILYGVNRGGDLDPVPPVATASTSDDADIWAAAIATIAQRPDQAAHLQSVQTVLLSETTATVTGAERANKVRAFSAAEKDRIADLVGKSTHLQVRWSEGGFHPRDARCVQTLASVSVGTVVDKGDHREVRTSIAYDCGYQYFATYRVEKRDGIWSVTGIVGVPRGVVPASCPMSGRTPASPQAGC
ncbi:hypothetical protein ACGFIF_33045 [Kribbella sp. NPDC049174]|uniref:hypothetical protein n=1 Tax=Kribbella sp. NPDC049174 TaxID=3364112 RepID=UPI00371946E2